MLLLISLFFFVIVFILVYMALSAYVPIRGQVSMRLKALDSFAGGRSEMDDELAKPFAARILAPLTGSLAGTLTQVTPSALRKAVDEKIVMAGGFGGLGTDGFLLVSAFLAFLLAALTGLVIVFAGAPAKQGIKWGLVAFLIGALLPYLLLNQKVTARKASIQKSLPDVLDLLTVSVEAGLGFDGALTKLSEKMKGALVDEFTRTLQELRVGVPRREALYSLGQRCGVADLSLFTTALIQADQLGVSIGNVLRVQSTAMREKRRQRAQERAMKAPVKMLIPLVLFVFPAIFVILVGPAAIRIITTLAK